MRGGRVQLMVVNITCTEDVEQTYKEYPISELIQFSS